MKSGMTSVPGSTLCTKLSVMLSSSSTGETWQTLEDRAVDMMTIDPLQETKVEAIQDGHHHRHHHLQVVIPQALPVRLLSSQGALGDPQEAGALEDTQ